VPASQRGQAGVCLRFTCGLGQHGKDNSPSYAATANRADYPDVVGNLLADWF
jgi:hypothetical protein